MKDITEEISKRGVKCRHCRQQIRKGKVYFQNTWAGQRYMEHENFCITCFPEVAADEIAEARGRIKQLENMAAKAIDLQPKYSADDMKICLTCKYKLKHAVGHCNPTEQGCYHKELKCGKKQTTTDTAAACVVSP